MMPPYCCEIFQEKVEFTCDVHKALMTDCCDYLIAYSEHHGAYGLVIHDGGSSMCMINYCPWCGTDIRKKESE